MDIQQNQSNVFPKFYIQAVEDKPASKEAGRPIFKEVEKVDIYIAGDNKTVVSKKVTEEHKQRWPQQYQAFSQGQSDALHGTPLEQWPVLSVAKVEELKALNILTVEALAELPDTSIQRLGMGGRELSAKAKAFIEAASGNADISKLAEENSKMKDEIEFLKKQIEELGAEKKPTRRRKAS